MFSILGIFEVLVILIFLYAFRYAYRLTKFMNQKYISKETTILITGGCLGIGRKLIHHLITLFKCKIINIDIRESEFSSLKSLYNDNIINIKQDISKIDNIISFLEEKGIDPDKIDIVINNAGIANNLPLEQLPLNNMISTMEINLLSPMKIIKAFIDKKKNKDNNNKKIHFVTLCSIMSHMISGNSSDYISSKWGLFAFVESVRNEYLYNDKYIFTTVCPFAVNTGMFPNFFYCTDTKWVAMEILKSIVFKEKVKYIPQFLDIPIFLYKLIPYFLSDLIQYYLINPFSKNIGKRTENDELLK